MPIRVPVYQQQVATTAVPGFRQRQQVTPDDFGAGVARAATGAAQAGISIWEREREKASSAVLMDAYARLGDADFEIRSALREAKGAKAMPASDRARERYDKTAQEIRDSISDDAARSQFDQMVLRRRDGLQRFALSHTGRENDAAAAAAADSATTVAINSAVNAITDVAAEDDPEASLRYMESVTEGYAAIRKHADNLGVSPEKALLQFDTQLHSAAVQALLDNGASEHAKEYLSGNRDRMDKGVASKMQRLVTAAVFRDTAKDRADDIWFGIVGEKDENGVEKSPYGNLPAALEQLQAMDLPAEEHDAALANLTRLANGASSARRLNDQPLLAELEIDFLSGKGTGLDSERYDNLSPEGQRDYLRIVRSAQRSQRSARRQDRSLQRDLDRLIESEFDALDMVGEDGEDQSTVDVYAGRYLDASPRMRNRLRAKQQKVNRNRAKTDGASERNFKASLDSDIQAEKMGKKEAKLYKAVMGAKYQAYRDAPENEGRPEPSIDTIKQWRIEALRRGEISWGRDRRQFQAEGDEFTIDDDIDIERNRRTAERIRGATADPAETRAPPAGSGTVTYILDGKEYPVSRSRAAEFAEQYPRARLK